MDSPGKKNKSTEPPNFYETGAPSTMSDGTEQLNRFQGWINKCFSNKQSCFCQRPRRCQQVLIPNRMARELGIQMHGKQGVDCENSCCSLHYSPLSVIAGCRTFGQLRSCITRSVIAGCRTFGQLRSCIRSVIAGCRTFGQLRSCITRSVIAGCRTFGQRRSCISFYGTSHKLSVFVKMDIGEKKETKKGFNMPKTFTTNNKETELILCLGIQDHYFSDTHKLVTPI